MESYDIVRRPSLILCNDVQQTSSLATRSQYQRLLTAMAKFRSCSQVSSVSLAAICLVLRSEVLEHSKMVLCC